MSDNAKYVVIPMEGLDAPVIFPAWVNHRDVVCALGFSKDQVRSAGFVEANPDGTFRCFGKSDTLGKASQPELDARLVKKLLNPNPY